MSLLLGIITSLLVPKVLGLEGFAYWQLFLFYGSYTGFCSLGIHDGVYLLNGGRTREELDASSITAQFAVSLFVEGAFAIAFMALAFCGEWSGERSFVLAACGIYLVIYNASTFLGFVFQAVNETKLFSYSVLIDRCAFLVPLLALLLCRCDSFEPYVISYLVARIVSLSVCLWWARDILKQGMLPVREACSETFASMRVGIKLMLANIASSLILGIARFAIDAVWGIEEFGAISFSLTIANFVLAFVGQVSMVLFPALRRVDEDELRDVFEKLREGLSLLLPNIYLVYFPAVWLLQIWLPQYAPTLYYFALLLPLCVFDSEMSLCGTTYFKVMRRESALLAANVATVLVSALGTVVGVFVLNSADFVIAGAVAAIALRALGSMAWLARVIGARRNALVCGELVLTLLFIAVALNMPLVPGFCLCLCVFALRLLIHRKRIAGLMSSLG